MPIRLLKKDLTGHADKKRALILQRFFKTAKGEYAEGDIFIGIKVPDLRKIAKNHEKNFGLEHIIELLHSEIHEERFIALAMLVKLFQKGDHEIQRKIFDLYLKNTRWINNWDLVDMSAEHIIGAFIFDKKTDILIRLAHSQNFWERRISMLATFYFLKKGQSAETLKIAKILLKDKHDLIHKAVGWMLREMGKRCSKEELKKNLKTYSREMPRTMLRYAIEHFPEKERKSYLNSKNEAAKKSRISI